MIIIYESWKYGKEATSPILSRRASRTRWGCGLHGRFSPARPL